MRSLRDGESARVVWRFRYTLRLPWTFLDEPPVPTLAQTRSALSALGLRLVSACVCRGFEVAVRVKGMELFVGT